VGAAAVGAAAGLKTGPSRRRTQPLAQARRREARVAAAGRASSGLLADCGRGGAGISSKHAAPHLTINLIAPTDMPNLPLIPVPAPAICSQTIAEASTWYKDAVARIPECVDEELSTYERLVEAWGVKCRLRLAAALSLYDPELVEDFFAEFPLPSVARLLDLARLGPESEDPGQWALDRVLGPADVGSKAFPATVGEAIGMTMHNVDGKSFVMTEEGWREQSPIKASPLLPHPGMVTSAIYPTTCAWTDAPTPGDGAGLHEREALFVAQGVLWLCYALEEPGVFAVVAFDGHVEHQVSKIDPDTLRNHPYAGAGLKALAINELSESLQSIYWAPLRAKHWVASLPSSTLDVVARSARVVSSASTSGSAREALLAAPGFAGHAT